MTRTEERVASKNTKAIKDCTLDKPLLSYVSFILLTSAYLFRGSKGRRFGT